MIFPDRNLHLWLGFSSRRTVSHNQMVINPPGWSAQSLNTTPGGQSNWIYGDQQQHEAPIWNTHEQHIDKGQEFLRRNCFFFNLRLTGDKQTAFEQTIINHHKFIYIYIYEIHMKSQSLDYLQSSPCFRTSTNGFSTAKHVRQQISLPPHGFLQCAWKDCERTSRSTKSIGIRLIFGAEL
jgi:hypothetical protein